MRTLKGLPLIIGGRCGSRQVVMAFMDWATHVLQRLLQLEAKK